MGDRLLTSTNIPAIFQGVSFEHYDVRLGDEHNWKQLQCWEPEIRPNVFLYGKPGRAKTMLACAALLAQQATHSHVHCSGKVGLDPACRTLLQQRKWPIYFIQMAEYIDLHIRLLHLRDDVRAGLRDPSDYLDLDRLLQDLKDRVQLLVVDDIGKEHRTQSGFADDSFDLLVRTRHNNGLSTIYTSNISLGRLKMCNYSPSMQNFFERTSLVLEF